MNQRPHLNRVHRGAGGLLALALLVGGCDGEGSLAPLELDAEATPIALDLGTVWAGRTESRTVRVTNTGAAPLRIEAAVVNDASGPALTSVNMNTPNLAAGEQAQIEVRFTTVPLTTGLFTGTVHIDVGFTTFDIPLTASIRPEPPCDDGNPCTEDTFDGNTCQNVALADGAGCDDGNACTINSVCASGQCLGQALDCNDNVECTIDACDPGTGCVFEPNPARCDDGDGCTDDVCVAGLGCTNTPSTPGTICHYDGCHEIGVCTAGSCVISPTPNGLPCEDGDGCTEGDYCFNGECQSGEPSEVGPVPPLTLAEGTYGTSLCLPDLSCSGFAQSTVQNVLDVRQDVGGGSIYVVWQGEYFNTLTGLQCTPLFLQPLGPISSPAPAPVPPLVPVDGGAGEAPDPEPPPPDEEACSAGIFYTRLSDSVGAVPTTVQLTATQGPVAAAVYPALPFGIDPPLAGGISGRLLVVTSDATGDQIRLQLFNDMGAQEQRIDLDSVLPLQFETVGNGIGALRVARWQSDAVVVAQPRYRLMEIDCADTTEDCTDGDCCTSTSLTAVHLDLSAPDPVTGTRRLYTNDFVTADCIGDATAPPFIVDDLHATVSPVDSALEVTLRMSTDACADADLLPSAADDRIPYRFVFNDPNVGWEGSSPLTHNPALGFAGVETFRHEAASGRAAAVFHANGCDTGVPVNPPDASDGGVLDCDGGGCGDLVACDERWAGFVNLSGGEVAMQDKLVGPLTDVPAQAYPMLVELQPKLLVRAGQQLRLVHRDTDGVIQLLQPPALDDGYLWDHAVPMQGQEGFIGGIASRTSLVACCPNEEEPCDCDADLDGDGLIEMSMRRLVVQGFKCGADARPTFGCVDGLDCATGEICAGREALCLPVEEPCEVADPTCTPLDNCGGRCVDVDNTCYPVLDPCVPLNEVPLCPVGASAAQIDCAWTCVDPLTCAIIDDTPADAGTLDAGADAGHLDAGASADGGTFTSDAGSPAVDAGVDLDAGVADSGPLSDAGSSDAG